MKFSFIEMLTQLKSYQRQILEFLHTSDTKAVLKTFQQVNRPNDNGISASGTKQLPGSNSHQAGERVMTVTSLHQGHTADMDRDLNLGVKQR